MSRLDAPVSGVVLLARTRKAAARLTEQFRTRAVEKVYWAIVSGDAPREGACVDWIVKDERHRRMHVSTAKTPGAQEARLTFRRLREVTGGWLLEIALETGRKHQIRLQLAHRGLPVVGDRKYGSRMAFPAGHRPARPEAVVYAPDARGGNRDCGPAAAVLAELWGCGRRLRAGHRTPARCRTPSLARRVSV